MIKVYTGLKGFAVFLFFIAGVVLFLSVFFYGVAKAAQLLLPLLIVISYLLIVVFLLGVLPAAFFKILRPVLSMYAMLMSHVLGAAAWMVSFFVVVKAFGFWGILFALLFQFLAPVAIIGAMLQGSWVLAGHLSVWIIFTYGMRFYSQWLLSLNPRDQKNRDIIDVDAIEVEKKGTL